MTLVKLNNRNKAYNNALTPWFNDVFESVLNDSVLNDRLITNVPAVNIAENENEFHIELAVPGLVKEDFKINLDKNLLRVSVEKKEDNSIEKKKYTKREYTYTSFVRSFTLPESVDYGKIDATYVDGILKLSVPKKEEAKLQSREITIK